MSISVKAGGNRIIIVNDFIIYGEKLSIYKI